MEAGTVPRFDDLTLLLWKNEVQFGGSCNLQGGTVCPVVEARGLGELGDWSKEKLSKGRFTAGDVGSCAAVADRWWLVAGRRRLESCPLDPRLANMLSLLVMLIRLMSLLGAIEGAVELVGERTAAEPWDAEKAESGPRLDLGLSCWEGGRRESRLLQELCDEAESRDTSLLVAAATSPERTYDWRLLAGLGKTCLLDVGG